MGVEATPGKIEPKMGSLYTVDKDHKIQKPVTDVDISNGLAWSADNKTMYYIDSMPRKLFAFDYDGETGVISNCIFSVLFISVLKVLPWSHIISLK